MAKKEKIIKEATREDEKLLKSVTHNYADKVQVRNTTYNVRWMHPAIADRITCLIQKDGNDNKIISQGAALIVLGGFWKAHLFYWLLWRWFYYIRQYDNDQLQPLLDEMKKKIPLTQFLMTTMSLTGAKATLMNMRTEEAERTLQELATAQQEETEKQGSDS